MAKIDIKELLNKFQKKDYSGAVGFKLDEITEYLNETDPDQAVRIIHPYRDFNVTGKASTVHRDVHGVMPATYLYDNRAEVVPEESTTTLFYGTYRAGAKSFLPFLSSCDVYYVKNPRYEEDGTLVFELDEAPSWRTYL